MPHNVIDEGLRHFSGLIICDPTIRDIHEGCPRCSATILKKENWSEFEGINILVVWCRSCDYYLLYPGQM